jgi:dihydroxyacetone kinase-like protein
MSALTTVDVARLFAMLATRLGAARDELCQLDGVIGDGDHGIAMAQGFAAAAQAIDMLAQGATLTDQFNAAAKGFLNAVGASSGPLYATAFMRAGKVAGLRTEMPLDEAPHLVVAMAEGIQLRGKAEPGEKTMVDVWAPAAAVVEAGMTGRTALPALMAQMQEVAAEGAEATKTMVATKGRAARLGERSLGHMDPGAASAAMILAVISQDWARLGA